MKPSKDINRLLEIMAQLRNRESGCPWDVEQTFATIAPYTIEEAYEVIDAIERDDMVDLRDELGDLLLQVVFHAQMASEAGKFDFGDVVDAITTKMIRRHPHVFGDEKLRGKKLAKGMWESIKAQEKAEKEALKAAQVPQSTNEDPPELPSLLDDVPRALPALIRAIKLQRKAATVGFDWSEAEPILDKIEEEIGELRVAIRNNNEDEAADELGDLLFAVANIGRHLDIEPEAALAGTNSKFARRFKHIEKSLHVDGKSPKDATLQEMEALWQEAKTRS